MGNSPKRQIYETSESGSPNVSDGLYGDCDGDGQDGTMRGMDGRQIRLNSSDHHVSLTAEQQAQYLDDLTAAIEQGDVKKVRLILCKGINLRKLCTGQFYPKPPLVSAAENGDLEICKLILDHGADVNQQHLDGGATALSYASENGYVDIVRLLLKSGANPNLSVEKEYIPLGIRCELDEVDPSKIDEIIEPYQGNNSLMKSCREHHIEVVRELLKWKCQINNQNIMGNTALHISCLSRTKHAHASSISCFVPARLFLGGNANIGRLLLDHGAHVNIRNGNNETALIRALMLPSAMANWELGMVEKIEMLDNYKRLVWMLLQAGSDVSIRGPTGQSILKYLLGLTTALINYEILQDFSLELCDIITGVVSLGCRFCEEDGNWRVEHDVLFARHLDLLQMLNGAMATPLSLKEMSRNVIRSHMREPLLTNVKTLRIPKLSQCYITLNAH